MRRTDELSRTDLTGWREERLVDKGEERGGVITGPRDPSDGLLSWGERLRVIGGRVKGEEGREEIGSVEIMRGARDVIVPLLSVGKLPLTIELLRGVDGRDDAARDGGRSRTTGVDSGSVSSIAPRMFTRLDNRPARSAEVDILRYISSGEETAVTRSLDSRESVYIVTGVCTRETNDSGLSRWGAPLFRLDWLASVLDTASWTTGS